MDPARLMLPVLRLTLNRLMLPGAPASLMMGFSNGVTNQFAGTDPFTTHG